MSLVWVKKSELELVEVSESGTRTQRSDTQIGHFFVTIIFRKMGEVAGLRKGRRGENGAHARNGLARYI